MSLSSIKAKVGNFIATNSPAILTGIGVVGTAVTAVLAGQASYKASRIIFEEDLGLRLGGAEETNLKEKVALVWPLYIPPIGVGVTTAVCIILANRISDRRMTALAAAYSLSEKAFHEYRDKINEKFGENKAKQVVEEIAQDKVRDNPPPPDSEVIIANGHHQSLFLDSYTGRYFMSDMEVIKKAENEINHLMVHNYYATLSDFYERIGLPRVHLSDDVGWNSNELLELRYSATISDDSRPCIVIDFNVAPVRSFQQIH